MVLQTNDETLTCGILTTLRISVQLLWSNSDLKISDRLCFMVLQIYSYRLSEYR